MNSYYHFYLSRLLFMVLPTNLFIVHWIYLLYILLIYLCLDLCLPTDLFIVYIIYIFLFVSWSVHCLPYQWCIDWRCLLLYIWYIYFIYFPMYIIICCSLFITFIHICRLIGFILVYISMFLSVYMYNNLFIVCLFCLMTDILTQ